MTRVGWAAAGLAAVALAIGSIWWAVGTAGLTPPGEVTMDPSLPNALPLPDGIWEETGPGWVLATYRGTGVGEDHRIPGPQVVYLVAPSGERYQVAELPTTPLIRLEAWAAGASTATVLPGAWDPSGTWSGSDWSTLDLVTGEVTSNGWTGLSPDAQFVDHTPDGTAIWSNPGIAPDWPIYGIIDSTGMAVAYDYAGPRQPSWAWVFADSTDALPPAGDVWCQTSATFDADSVLQLCGIASGECCDTLPGLEVTQNFAYARKWTDGSGRTETLHRFTADDPAPGLFNVAVGGDRVVFEGSEWRPGSEPVGAFVLEGGVLRRLEGIDATGHPDPRRFLVSLVGDSTVYTEVGGLSGTPPWTATALVRTDLDTRTTVVLFPYPAPDAFGDIGATRGYALTSYIILDAYPQPLKGG